MMRGVAQLVVYLYKPFIVLCNEEINFHLIKCTRVT